MEIVITENGVQTTVTQEQLQQKLNESASNPSVKLVKVSETAEKVEYVVKKRIEG